MALIDQYLSQLFALLPRGRAWRQEGDTILGRLLTSAAHGLAQFHAEAAALIDEADPRTTDRLLPDWERVAALSAGDLDDDSRRNQLVVKLTAEGGQSKAHFTDLAARLGHEVSITTYRPATCETPCDALLYGEAWAFAWRVDAPAEAEAPGVLAAALQTAKPAHTSLFIAYGE